MAVKVQGLKADDMVDIVAYGQRDPRLDKLVIKEIGFSENRIFVPAGHLVYPGDHVIEMGADSNPTE